jgi:hypothetical protein
MNTSEELLLSFFPGRGEYAAFRAAHDVVATQCGWDDDLIYRCEVRQSTAEVYVFDDKPSIVQVDNWANETEIVWANSDKRHRLDKPAYLCIRADRSDMLLKWYEHGEELKSEVVPFSKTDFATVLKSVLGRVK